MQSTTVCKFVLLCFTLLISVVISSPSVFSAKFSANVWARITPVLLPHTQVSVGTDDVALISFKVKSLVDAQIRELIFEGNNFDSAHLEKVYLYEISWNEWVLIDSYPWSKIKWNKLILDEEDTSINLKANVGKTLLLSADIVDNTSLVGDKVRVRLLNTYIIRLANNKNIWVFWIPTNSQNIVTLTEKLVAGMLHLKVDNLDTKTNRPKHVVAGTTSDYVSSFEMTAIDEASEIEDLVITAAGAGATTFSDEVKEVVIFDDAGTELFRELVTSNEIVFDNVNFIVPLGTTNIYVKVITDLIGSNENGMTMSDVAFTLIANGVVGVTSNEDITPSYDGGNTTLSSYPFDVISVHLSAIDLVSNFSSYSIPSSTSNSLGVNLAILKITTDDWDNTDIDDNSSLDLVLQTVEVTNSTPSVATNLTMKRIDVSNWTELAGSLIGDLTVFDLSYLSPLDNEISKSSVAYYLIKGDINSPSNTTVRLSVRLLNDGWVVYDSSDFNSQVTSLRLWVNEVLGPLVFVDVN